MPMRGVTTVSATASRVLLCVDQYVDSEIFGRLYGCTGQSPANFCGIVDLANRMEQLFDQRAFPQAYFTTRSFGKPKLIVSPKKEEAYSQMDETVFETERGEKSTFIVQVQFRQNATWQGTISWADKKKTQHFRSTLEMIKLMDEALSSQEASAEQFADWK